MHRTEPSLRRPVGHAAVAFLLMLAACFAIAGVTFREAQRRADDRFSATSVQTSNAIESALRHNLDELKDTGAFASSGTPSKTEFSDYVGKARVLNEFDAIVGLLVLERVEEADLDAFLARQRQREPDFGIASLGRHPPGMPYYILTHYVPGRLGVELPLGVDVSALATVQFELEPRSSTGDAFAGAVQNEPLIREAARQLGETEYGELFRRFDFMVAVPVYGHPDGAAAGEPARMWVAAPVGTLDDILSRSLQGQPDDLGVNLTVDVGNPALADLGIENVAEREAPGAPADRAAFTRHSTFETDGLRWSVSVWSTPNAGDSSRQLLFVLLGLGVVVSVASAVAIYLRSRGKLRERSYRELMDAHERARLQRDVLASVSEAVVVLDDEADIIVRNSSWDTFCRRARADDPAAPASLRYTDVLGALTGDDTAPIAAQIAAVIGGAERWETEITVGEGDGLRWFELVATPLHGRAAGAVIVHRDVTSLRRAENELRRRADHDSLTGLLNRSAMEREARALVDRARDEEQHMGALFLDLDDFKVINDTYGHEAGDEVLCTVAHRMLDSVRATDLVSRQGGDEFLIVLHPLEDRGTVDQLACRLLEAINEPIEVGGQMFRMNASIGVVDLEAHELSLAKLISLSDQAMYEAKAHGGAQFAAVS